MQNVPFAAQQEQVNKFLAATRALGAQMDQMQGTTRTVYDTVDFGTSTSYSFFSELPSKQTTTFGNAPATNLTENRFEPGEGMVIKELGFVNYSATNAANLNTSITALALVDIVVGNQRVVKDLPLLAGSTISAINNINTKISGTEAGIFNCTRLFTNIVIPPQVQFFVNVRLPYAPDAAAAGEAMSFVRCYLKGYGKLFNPRNNY